MVKTIEKIRVCPVCGFVGYTEDVVEVVRCKDCKYGEKRIEDYKCWMLDEDWDIRFSPMHFCSYGRRKEESEVEE